MVNKMIGLSLACTILILSACGNNAAENELKAQQALDSGNYSAAISTLEAKKVKTQEDNMLLASSYMGKAGFSLTDTVNIVSKSVANNNVSTDTFANFSNSVLNAKDPQTLQNIQKAITYYRAVSVVTSKSYNARATTNKIVVGDRDLYLGLAYLTKATVALGYFGDVAKLKSSQTVGNEMLASACAIVNIYSPTSALPSACVSVSRVKIAGNYTKLNIILNNGNGKTFLRLANKDATEMLLSDYSSNPLTSIKIDSKDVTIKSVLIDTINNAFSLIESIAPIDMKSDINKFKTDIGIDSNGQVNPTTFSNYIAKVR